MMIVWPFVTIAAARSPIAIFSARFVVLVSSRDSSMAPARGAMAPPRTRVKHFSLLQKLEVLADCDFGDFESILEFGNTHPPVDFNRTTNRVMPQGGLESDGLIGCEHY